jgi:hypothetical protein
MLTILIHVRNIEYTQSDSSSIGSHNNNNNIKGLIAHFIKFPHTNSCTFTYNYVLVF